MQLAQTLTIQFHNASLLLIDQAGQPFVPMKPVVEGMGLTWAAQTVKLNNNKARWGVSIIEMPSSGGIQPCLCLPLRKLSGWFASIQPNKVKPELREGIIAYQNECDDALWAYWNDQRASAVQVAPAPVQAAPDIQPLFAQRWLTTFDKSGGQHTRLLPMDKCIMNTAEFIDHVSHLNEHDIPTPQLLQLTMKLMSQLGRRKLDFAGIAS